MDFTIRPEDPGQPDVIALLEHGEAHSASLYPAESNHHLPLEALRAPEVYFLVARDADGRAVATGALARKGDWAEVKRMWVEDDFRGRGLSKRLLDALIEKAGSEGIKVLRLETGVENHDALGLYARYGFATRGPFEGYHEDPLSVFMEKPL